MTIGDASFLNIEKFSLWVGKPGFRIAVEDLARDSIRISDGRKGRTTPCVAAARPRCRRGCAQVRGAGRIGSGGAADRAPPTARSPGAGRFGARDSAACG